MSSRQRRVVITGVGAISPLGNTKEALWEALASGRSGVGPLSAISPEATGVHAAAAARQFSGEIDDFGPLEKEQKKAIRKGLKVMCRECQMGVAAAQLALADAGLGLGQVRSRADRHQLRRRLHAQRPGGVHRGHSAVRRRAGGRSSFPAGATTAWPRCRPLWLLKYLPNMPASHLAIYNDLRGPNNSLTLREAAANLALGEAFQIILRGSAEAMLVGATGTRLHCMKIVHSLQQEELACGQRRSHAHQPPLRSQPHRHGAGRRGRRPCCWRNSARAQARGATIYGEVLSAASSSVVAPKLAGPPPAGHGNVLAGRAAGRRRRRPTRSAISTPTA